MATSAVATFGVGIVTPLKRPKTGRDVIRLKPSTTFAAGTLVGEIGTTGVYGPYASGNSDGTQNPTHVLEYGGVTDSGGKISFGAGPAGTSEWSQTELGMPAWRGGLFACADLVGLDANAVSKLGRLVQGDVTTGRVEIYGN